ncbi:hypothetical protein INR49_029382, partial [Caranx melampygus]
MEVWSCRDVMVKPRSREADVRKELHLYSELSGWGHGGVRAGEGQLMCVCSMCCWRREKQWSVTKVSVIWQFKRRDGVVAGGRRGGPRGVVGGRGQLLPVRTEAAARFV